MHNWKKEGYKVEDNVCIIGQSVGWTSREIKKSGKVIYVGTKILKVEIDRKDDEPRILTFNGKDYTKGEFFGNYYVLYKTEEDYDNMVKDRKKKILLQDNIIKNINKLSLLELEKIKEIIDSK